ncbi:MAG: type II toxin-antitoxin system HicA family toxin [Paludibacteraceae bacterium]|nr:type II toxin-antitoxin system HicA family toxin [Paludibacteraceae bacterium]
MKVKEIIKKLEDNHWVFKRMKGDHRVYFKEGKGIVVVPGKLSDDIPKGTEQSILRAMGV